MVELPFADRASAGRVLAEQVSRQALPPDAIVLGLPRGGVPVAAEVAKRLGCPVDVLVVRKLGVPWQPELAMGAMAAGVQSLDEELIRALDIPPEQVEAVAARERHELERRELLYRGSSPAPLLKGRVVVLVDDGLATGSSMLAAAKAIRKMKPARIIVAVPVGSAEACQRLRREVEVCICLANPRPFGAVGAWYDDFRQVNDSDVRYLLDQCRSASPAQEGKQAES